MENVYNFGFNFIFLLQNVNDVIVNYNAAHDQQKKTEKQPSDKRSEFKRIAVAQFLVCIHIFIDIVCYYRSQGIYVRPRRLWEFCHLWKDLFLFFFFFFFQTVQWFLFSLHSSSLNDICVLFRPHKTNAAHLMP